MADQINTPINYPVIAGGKIVVGGKVLFGNENQRPDEDNPATLKAIFVDSNLQIQAQNPQPLGSNGEFDQSVNGTLYGPDNAVYSVLILDRKGKELSYTPSFNLSDTSAATSAAASAAAAAASESNAAASESAAAAIGIEVANSYVDFVNRYFGAFASDPSVDPAGNPPNEGSIYFNTVSDVFFTWNGSAWINYFPSNPNGLLVTATGTTTPRALGDRFADVVNLANEPNLQAALIKANSTGKLLLHNSAAIQIRVPTDLPTLQEAVDVGYNIFPKVPIEVMIESGYKPSSGISVSNGDYSNIIVSSIDSEVVVDAAFSGRLIDAISAHAPTLNCSVNGLNLVDRMYSVQNGVGRVNSGFTFKNMTGRGWYANNSLLSCGGTTWDGIGDSLYASAGSSVQFGNGVVINSTVTANGALTASRGSAIEAQNLSMTDCYNGIECKRAGSSVNAHDATFNNITGVFLVRATRGSSVSVDGMTATNISSTAGLEAYGGSLSAQFSASIQGTGTYGVRVSSASSIAGALLTIDGFSTSAYVSGGSTAELGSATFDNASSILLVETGVANLGNATINGSVNNAITATEGATVDISGLTATNIQQRFIIGSGCTITGDSSTTITASAGNNQTGITLNSGSLNMVSSTIQDFGLFNLWLRNSSSSTLELANILNSGSHGVFVEGGARLTLTDASVTGSGSGDDIRIAEGSWINAKGCSTTNSVGTPAIGDTNLVTSFNALEGDKGIIWV